MQLSCIGVDGFPARVPSSLEKMAPARRKKTAAVLALLCLAAFLCGDITRGVHLLTARHVVCAAHGELVEADSAGGSSSDDDGSVAAATPAEDGDHHEHCSVAATPTRAFAAGIRPPAFAGFAPKVERTIALPAPGHALGRLVLAYAPKQGPPSRSELRRS